MAIYNYTRTLTNGIWDINNPNDVDVNGNSVTLASRIKDDVSLGPLIMNEKLNDTLVSLEFSTVLSGAEQTTLDQIVAAHKSAAGVHNLASFVILLSPDGTAYKLCVDNAGLLTTELA